LLPEGVAPPVFDDRILDATPGVGVGRDPRPTERSSPTESVIGLLRSNSRKTAFAVPLHRQNCAQGGRWCTSIEFPKADKASLGPSRQHG
jgi:hypothetical protein